MRKKGDLLSGRTYFFDIRKKKVRGFTVYMGKIARFSLAERSVQLEETSDSLRLSLTRVTIEGNNLCSKEKKLI